MRTLVLTGYDEKFRELGELTTPGKEEYARKHGFDFNCLTDGPVGHPSWWKMHYLQDTREYFDRVIWLDADILITNMDVVPPGESGYHCSLDWGVDATEPWMLSNGCFAAFPDSEELIEWVLANRGNYSCEFHEQEHMRAAARGEFKDIITVHPRRVYNAVPVEIHASVVEPWQPGDWVAHLTMVDLAERIRLVGEIGRQAGSK